MPLRAPKTLEKTEKNRVLGGISSPPQNPIFFSRGLAAARALSIIARGMLINYYFNTLCRCGRAPLGLLFRLAKNMARPAEKDSLFLHEMSQLLLSFFSARTQKLSQKNKQKTLFFKHAYPVLGGAVNKSSFLLIFFRNSTAISKKK